MQDSPHSPHHTTIFASFWERTGALVVDCIILWIAFSLLGNLFHGGSEHVFFGIAYQPVALILQLSLTWFYYVLQESSAHQATFGKRIFQIKVTDYNNVRITLGKAAIRSLFRLVSGLFLLSGFFMMLGNSKKQTLHDKIAKTLVIHS